MNKKRVDYGISRSHVAVLVIGCVLALVLYGVIRLVGTIETNRTLGPSSYESH